LPPIRLCSDNTIVSLSDSDAFLRRKSIARSLIIFQIPVSLRPLLAQKSSMQAVRICSGGDDASLSHMPSPNQSVVAPERQCAPRLQIGRYSPQPQSHIERIEAERGPEGKLANPVLFRMAGGAQWNGVAIARLHPYTTIGSCTHMRGVRWRCFAAGDTGELTDKSQMLHPPTQVRLGLAARGAPGDARCGHRYQELPARSGSDAG